MSLRRRDVITLLGGAAGAWPLAARAQRSSMPVVGYLDPGQPSLGANFLAAFRRGMSEAGYVVGQNVSIEYRFGRSENEGLLNSATELVRGRVAVIFANGAGPAFAAKAATATIPIVFVTGADPVELGLVASFNRPAGNLTGVAFQSTEITAKRFDLLHQLAPAAETITFLAGGEGNDFFTRAETRDLQSAARALGVGLRILPGRTDGEIERVFANSTEHPASALLISSSFQAQSHARQIISLAASHAVPTMFPTSTFVAAGGLSSYGYNPADLEYQAGLHVGRILKGAKPAELPVVQLTKFEFVVNLRTAKQLGLTVPGTVLAIADRVIE